MQLYAALLAWSHDLSLSILLYFLQVKLIYILGSICLNLKAGSMELSSILTGLAKCYLDHGSIYSNTMDCEIYTDASTIRELANGLLCITTANSCCHSASLTVAFIRCSSAARCMPTTLKRAFSFSMWSGSTSRLLQSSHCALSERTSQRMVPT